MPDPTPNAFNTERIVFSGRVQGVGFRFTARSIARRFPVSGYVRNLADGTVELVVRGAAGAISDLLSEISARFQGNIAHIDRQPAFTDEPLSGFDIRP